MRVAFFVSEVAKWKGQALFDLMNGSQKFEPQIIVYPTEVETKDSPIEQEAAITAKVDYYRNKGMAVFSPWNVTEQRFLIEKMSDIDICFYQQPWDLPPAPYPRQIASRTLTFYFPYYIGGYFDNWLRYRTLYFELFRQIMLSPKQVKSYYNVWSAMTFSGKCIGLGHPFLDQFRNKKKNNTSKNTVIYAPHFSFPVEGINRPLTVSTFLDNGLLLLEFAKAHPEISWVFKPHPKLRRELVDTNTWPKDDVDAYYNEWERIGTVCYTSDYVDLFIDSQVMITDCSSFLTEYSCTGHPLIHLIPGKIAGTLNPEIEGLFNFFYKATDNTTLIRLLDQIVLGGEDPNKAERIKYLEKTGLLNSQASENIMDYIDKLLK